MEARWSMAAMPITEAQPGTADTARTGITVMVRTARPPTMARTGLPPGTVATQQTGTITRAAHIRMLGVEGQRTRPTAPTEPCTLRAAVIATSPGRPTTMEPRGLPRVVRPITVARIRASDMSEAQTPAASTGEGPRALGGTTTAGRRERQVAAVGEVCTPVVSTAAVSGVSSGENHGLRRENRYVDWE